MKWFKYKTKKIKRLLTEFEKLRGTIVIICTGIASLVVVAIAFINLPGNVRAIEEQNIKRDERIQLLEDVIRVQQAGLELLNAKLNLTIDFWGIKNELPRELPKPSGS